MVVATAAAGVGSVVVVAGVVVSVICNIKYLLPIYYFQNLPLDLLVRLIYQPVVVGVVDSVDVVVDVVDSVVGVVDSVEVEVVVVVVVGHASSAQLVVSSACDPSTSQ